MTDWFPSQTDWIRHCQRTTSDDFDNIVGFTGPPGAGKSTLELQILWALDDTFNEDRIAFNADGWIRLSKTTPKGCSFAGDELPEADRRNAMTSIMRRLTSRLQVCRSLNHHSSMCGLRRGDFDDRVVNRWRYHVEIHDPAKHGGQRGYWTLRERLVQERTRRDGSTYTINRWPIRGHFRFNDNPKTNRLWRGYLAAKERFSREGDGNSEADASSQDAWNARRVHIINRARSLLEREHPHLRPPATQPATPRRIGNELP